MVTILPNLILKHSPVGAEVSGEQDYQLFFTHEGMEIPLPLGPELPCYIQPRLISASPSEELKHPLNPEFLKLIQTTKIPKNLIIGPQHIDRRTRSLNLLDLQAEKQYTVQGFGAGIDMTRSGNAEIFFDLPSPGIPLADFDALLLDGHQMGTTTITRNGEIVHTPNSSCLGGITQEKLQLKIANTQKAARILGKLAIVPNWIAQGEYTDLATDEGKLGWGVYELPLNLPSYQIAEIGYYLNRIGMKNDLFNEYIFKTFRALRQLHNHDQVHGQPHKGNLHGTFNKNGSIVPIISDWSTMYFIGKHNNKRKIPGNDLNLTPKQQAMALDFNAALTSMLKSEIDIAFAQDPFYSQWSLKLNPSEDLPKEKYLQEVANITTAAILGYILPINFPPKNYYFEDDSSAGIGHIYVDLPESLKDLEEKNFDLYAFRVGDELMRGVHPSGPNDLLQSRTIKSIKELYSLY